MKQDHLNWVNNGAVYKECKKYFNVKNPPLFHLLPDNTHIFKITPLPSLHILMGIFSHIWKSMENDSFECKEACHKFALVNNCVKEYYWG